MPLVQYVATALALQIEGFPAELKEGEVARPFERSCEGSLHLRPGSTLELTADEYAHIKAKRPDVFSSLRCMMTDEQLTAASQPPEAAPKPEGDETAGGDESPRPGKSKRGG